jgi:predicted dehydrogenase
MKPAGIVILGLGMALPPHARALADLRDRAVVVGAWSPTAARREAAAEAFGLPPAADLDTLLRDPAASVALILTPPDSHAALARRCFEAGLHVLVEKPLDVSLEAAAAMVAQARALDRRLGVVLQHRHRPGFRILAEHLAAGRLGAVEAASLTVPWWRDQRYYDVPGRGTRRRDGGGVLMTQAIHALDAFRVLVGGARRVAARATTTALHRMECEDTVAAVMDLANGAPASLFASTAVVPGHAEEIRLVCSRGTATLTGGALVIDWLDGRRESIAETQGTGAGADPMAFSHAAHRSLIGGFLDAVARGTAPDPSGDDALATQHLIAALLASAEAGTWVAVDGP